MLKLSEAEIQKRLIRLTNLERLHALDQQTKAGLRAENKQLKQQLSDVVAKFEAIVKTQAARITELETMVFGQKPSGGVPAKPQPTAKQTRANSSYRRPLPPASAIIQEQHHAAAAMCGSSPVATLSDGCILVV